MSAVPVTLAGPGRPRVSDVPESGPLVDRYGRVHTDLRLSLTDRCNLRCVYCMPEHGMTFQRRAEHLLADEVERVGRVARTLGVTAVRLTGGEPLLRLDIVDIVGRLAAIGFADIALTTNGTRLATLAPDLAAAGLQRVNVSCDSLRPERFARIRRRGTLETVLAAMDAAEAAGLAPVKVNVVVMAGENEDEVEAFAAFARATGRVVRFIEFMPLDADGTWRRDRVVPATRVVDRIHARWPVEPIVAEPPDRAPASRLRFVDGGGEIGVIASVTQPFCGTCDRLRVTADGAIRNCLFSDDELSLRDRMRGGAPDEELARMFRRSIWGKQPGHGINDALFLRPARSMSMIGG